MIRALVLSAFLLTPLHAQTVVPQMLVTISDPGELTVTALMFNPFAGTLVSTSAEVLIRPTGAVAPVSATVVTAMRTTDFSEVQFVVPAGIPYGSAQILWRTGSETWRSLNVRVARSAFIITSAIRMISAEGPAAPVGLTTPVRPGQTIILTGKGLGYGNEVTATIGGASAKVVYAGHGPTAGYDTVQLQVPTSTTPGCYVPLEVFVGESQASGQLSVTTDGAPCPHPLSLSLAHLKTLDDEGSIQLRAINLMNGLNVAQETAAWRDESVSAGIQSYSAQTLATQFHTASPACSEIPAFFVYDPGLIGLPTAFADVPTDPLPPFGENATLRNGTVSFPLALDSRAGTYYGSLPAPLDRSLSDAPAAVIGPGTWTLNWAVDSFNNASIPFTVPVPLRINAAAVLPLRRGTDQAISWNGSDYGPYASMSLLLSGRGPDGSAGRTVECTAPASAGSISIPAGLLAGFAPGSFGDISTAVRVLTGSSQSILVNYASTDRRAVEFH